MKNRVNLMLFVLLAMAAMVSGCATLGLSTDPMVAAKQQGNIWNATYNSEFYDVDAILKNTLSTPTQRDMAVKKEGILKQVYPWLVKYKQAIDINTLPSSETSKAITDLINQLTVIATGGK